MITGSTGGLSGENPPSKAKTTSSPTERRAVTGAVEGLTLHLDLVRDRELTVVCERRMAP